MTKANYIKKLRTEGHTISTAEAQARKDQIAGIVTFSASYAETLKKSVLTRDDREAKASAEIHDDREGDAPLVGGHTDRWQQNRQTAPGFKTVLRQTARQEWEASDDHEI